MQQKVNAQNAYNINIKERSCNNYYVLLQLRYISSHWLGACDNEIKVD